MRIGILGGTFNPIHLGHLVLAEEACFNLKLDKLIFVPAFLPPHKEVEPDINPRHRLNMVKIAIEDNPRFEVSTFEMDSGKKSYSIETLREFRRAHGADAQLFFITGSDSLKDLSSWKDISEIFRISRFIVANRPGYPFNDVPKEVQTIVITPMDVSSQDIRRRVREGTPIRYLVLEKVRQYIIEHVLYKV